MSSSLSTLFRSEGDDVSAPADNTKLHDLYWNRAELKKEFAALRNEKYDLQERVKQEQGATARVQQKMNHLESLLLDREWVHNVVVFYQLRRLQAHCHNKLARFAEQLKQQHEDRIHGKALEAWNRRRNSEASRIEEAVGEVRLQTQLLEDQLQSERHRLMTMNRVARLFRGGKLQRETDALVERIALGQTQERELLEKLEANQTMDPPHQQGLGTGVKRSINFMILAFLQQLYINFSDDGLADLAREASEKSVGAINYGNKRDCDYLIERLESLWKLMDKTVDSAESLRQRAKLIAEVAVFRYEDDAVPVADSVATLFEIDRNGTVSKSDANLLGENYFGIGGVLSR